MPSWKAGYVTVSLYGFLHLPLEPVLLDVRLPEALALPKPLPHLIDQTDQPLSDPFSRPPTQFLPEVLIGASLAPTDLAPVPPVLYRS